MPRLSDHESEQVAAWDPLLRRLGRDLRKSIGADPDDVYEVGALELCRLVKYDYINLEDTRLWVLLRRTVARDLRERWRTTDRPIKISRAAWEKAASPSMRAAAERVMALERQPLLRTAESGDLEDHIEAPPAPDPAEVELVENVMSKLSPRAREVVEWRMESLLTDHQIIDRLAMSPDEYRAALIEAGRIVAMMP